MDSLKKRPSAKNTAAPALRSDFDASLKTVSLMPPRAPRRSKRRLFIFPVFLLLLFLGSAGFVLGKGLLAARHMELSPASAEHPLQELSALASNVFSPDTASLKQDTDGRINILLLGRAGESYPGKNLTDTVILLSLQTKTHQVALLSLPRDLLVSLPGGASTKLNALYQYGKETGAGTETIKEAVSDITGQDIHYTAVVDFDGFEELVDTLGGVRVEVPRDFTDTRYPGKNYSYETFEIKKGWQTLDGATALKYVRERHDDPEGDFGRAKRQQAVLQALKAKAFSLPTLVNPETLGGLLDTFGKNIQTDASLSELQAFYALSRTMDTQNIKTLVVDAWQKESLLRVSHVPLGGVSAFVLVPRAGNWSEIRERSAYIFDQDTLAREQNAIAKEAPRVLIVSAPGRTAPLESLRAALSAMGLEHVTFATLPPGEIPHTSAIIDQGNLEAPFALNALLRKFPLEKQDAATFPGLPESASGADLILVVGSDFAGTLPENTFGEPEEPDLPTDTP
jgi:LCP family protein required for cell wall assembly